MALTETQKLNVRLYMGWSARFQQTDSRLEQALVAVDQDNTATVAPLIISILASLATIDAEIITAHGRIKARKLGSIELNADNEIGYLRSEGRRFVGRLGAILGVAARHDVFAGMGTRHFAGVTGIYGDGSGGSNMPPRG